MSIQELMRKYPEVRDEINRLQKETSKEMLDRIKEGKSPSENIDLNSFTMGHLYGRFSLLTEMVLGIPVELKETRGFKDLDAYTPICGDCETAPCFCNEALGAKSI